MKRRAFIKKMIGTGAAASAAMFQSPFNLYLREARAAPNLPALVVIFQRGGCDGLNTVVPYGDSDYYNLRPTIAIQPPDQNDPESAIDLDGYFGLHPSLAGLSSIFDAGDLAVLPTVQYPGYSRSHFNSQHYIESGIRADDFDGWLNRYLARSSSASQMRAVHFGGSLAQALRGNVPVASFSFINSFNLGLGGGEEDILVDRVLPVYNQPPNPPTPYRQLVQDFGQLLFNSLDVASSIDTSSYEPHPDADYPNSSYGRRLREIAQLLKEPSVELEVATVDIGGWDTHSNQGGGQVDGRMARRLAEFANGINALYTDLGDLMNNVVILTMTEFGRTCKENGSQGTDHGVGSSWFVVGGNVNGGIYNGPDGWPGLANDQMISDRFLQYTTDYRDIMGDIISGHLANNDLDLILPGHAYTQQGLFSVTSMT